MRKRYASYFLLAALLFLFLNLPSSFVNQFRGKFLFADSRYHAHEESQLLQLKIENKKLQDDLLEVRNWIMLQDRIDTHAKKIEELLQTKKYSAFYERRIKDLLLLLEKEVYSINANVIFREPRFWASGFWINKGEKENREFQAKIIAKNSPVLSGDSLIGVVEIVEEKRSYVRLITDSSLMPAVRAIRGDEQNYFLLKNIVSVEEELQFQDGLATPILLQELEEVKEKLKKSGETLYLAKGELHGSSYPLWRSRSPVLKGVGFNYEFADDEGQARHIHDKIKKPLLQVGDLLITSGLDGIFPQGLPVAIVSKIYPLKEGDFSYNLEAELTAGNLDHIAHVQIYPPL